MSEAFNKYEKDENISAKHMIGLLVGKDNDYDLVLYGKATVGEQK